MSVLDDYINRRGALLSQKGEEQRQSVVSRDQYRQDESAKMGQAKQEEMINAGEAIALSEMYLDTPPEQRSQFLDDYQVMATMQGRQDLAAKIEEAKSMSPEQLEIYASENIKKGEQYGFVKSRSPKSASQPFLEPEIVENEKGEKVLASWNKESGGFREVSEYKPVVDDPGARQTEIEEAKLAADIKRAQTPGTAEYAEAQDRAQAQKKEKITNLEKARNFRYESVGMRDKAKKLMQEVSNGSLGFDGFIRAFVPGSKAFTDRGRIQELKSHIALEKMMDLKRLSPTGSTGFGALSERELETLENSIARLDPNMNDEEFRNQLGIVFDHYDRAVSLIDFEYAAPPRLDKNKEYTPEEGLGITREFAQMAIDSGFSEEEVENMLKVEGMLKYVPNGN